MYKKFVFIVLVIIYSAGIIASVYMLGAFSESIDTEAILPTFLRYEKIIFFMTLVIMPISFLYSLIQNRMRKLSNDTVNNILHDYSLVINVAKLADIPFIIGNKYKAEHWAKVGSANLSKISYAGPFSSIDKIKAWDIMTMRGGQVIQLKKFDKLFVLLPNTTKLPDIFKWTRHKEKERFAAEPIDK